VANFKLRAGYEIGAMVTLRGARMWEFFDRLVALAILAGSVIIAEFESLHAAQVWVAGDPYVTAGVFESYEVRPFIKVLP
jgi:uncharacterized protein YciI